MNIQRIEEFVTRVKPFLSFVIDKKREQQKIESKTKIDRSSFAGLPLKLRSVFISKRKRNRSTALRITRRPN